MHYQVLIGECAVRWRINCNTAGKGFATEAAIASRAHAYDVLGWDTAISQIDPANEASRAVATRLGASFEKHHEDPDFGMIEIWRHPSAADLMAGGMEAYA